MGEVTSQQLQRALGPFNSLRHSLHLKSPVISPFSHSNMKAFTMLGLVFVVVASAMFAKATDDEPGLCKVKWGEKMKKCQQGNEVDSLQRRVAKTKAFHMNVLDFAKRPADHVKNGTNKLKSVWMAMMQRCVAKRKAFPKNVLLIVTLHIS